MAFMNTTLQDATDTAHSIQTSWMAGHLSRYDLVDRFIDNLLVDGVSITHLLDRLHVLVTTTEKWRGSRKSIRCNATKGATAQDYVHVRP